MAQFIQKFFEGHFPQGAAEPYPYAGVPFRDRPSVFLDPDIIKRSQTPFTFLGRNVEGETVPALSGPLANLIHQGEVFGHTLQGGSADVQDAFNLALSTTGYGSVPRGAVGAGSLRRRRPKDEDQQVAGVGHNMPPEPLEPATATSIMRAPPSGVRAKPLGTGTSDIADDSPVSWRGRPLAEMTARDFAQLGKSRGVPNLGPETPSQAFKYQDGSSFEIPGGLEGTFTYYDLLRLKANAIDPSRIDPALHAQIQAKLSRTMTPKKLTDEHVFNSLLFGMLSPNQPLGPNQVAASRLRVRNKADVDRLASMVPWEVGDRVDDEVRNKASRDIANFFGVQSAEAGGLGVRGSANYTRIAELAKLFKEDPAWFRRGPEEPWDHFVERLSSQVTGLGTKTGSFSAVWQDPLEAAISAVDRHMGKIFYEDHFKTKKARRQYEKTLSNRWNDRVDRRREADQKLNANQITKEQHDKLVKYLPDSEAKRARGLNGILRQPGGDGFFTEQILSTMGAGEKQYRYASGKINPKIPEHLQTTRFIKDPEKIKYVGNAYRRALELNQAEANKYGLSLFSSQWMNWDRIRRRLEPHENMFPGLEKLPAPSRAQLQAVLDQMTQSGHKDYTKVPQMGAGGLDMRLNPTNPYDNPAAGAYFHRDPEPWRRSGLPRPPVL